MIDHDVHVQVEEIVGIVAEEAFEGWSTYWTDQQLVMDAIIILLQEWQDTAARLATENLTNHVS